MSDKLGARKYGLENGPIFLGKKMSEQTQDYSDFTAKEIDTEINELIDEAYEKATKILKKYKNVLVEVSKTLLEKEVIEGADFLKLFQEFSGTKKTTTNEKKETIPDDSQNTVSEDNNVSSDPNTGSINLDQPLDQPA